jgi:hypothetical protein
LADLSRIAETQTETVPSVFDRLTARRRYVSLAARLKGKAMLIPAGNHAEAVSVGVHSLPVWPEGQKVQKWRNIDILVTLFSGRGAISLHRTAERGRV